MGESLRIHLLGPPELVLGNTPVRIRSAKSRALLWHLAAARAPRSRAELAGLLWGERPDSNARGSLRLAISELRRAVGAWLDVSRDQVALRTEHACFVDHALLTADADIEEVLRLWRGDFLYGVAVDDAPAYSAWLAAERQRVHMVLRQVLLGRTASPDGQVVRLAHLLTSLDPLDEEAHRLLISALARTGNRAAALACYDALRVRLADELGVDPAPELQAVREQIACVSRPGRDPVRRGRVPRGSLPVPSTSLIGRDEEIAQVLDLLGRERLVSLLGPGGAGKTRLAIAAAQRCGDVAFVPFAGVHAEAAVTTAARHLGVDLSPSRPAEDVLVAALSARSVLLVLDNLEHLPGFDAVIERILRAAPGVRVLATSRRRLAVPGNVSVAVAGLAGHAAEALFAQRARAVQPSFDLDGELTLVSAVCHAAEGLPLAIELAAGLLRALPLEEVAQRLGMDLDLLAAPEPACRPRHGTMRAVFETSWQLLARDVQQTLAGLAVFSGGFTLAAALDVTRCGPRVLVRLVDHCMLQLDPDGRYQIHPLIQQYARAHLPPDVRQRHGEYFARFLDEHAEALQDGADTTVIRLISPELDNIRTAWAARSQDASFLDRYWTVCLRLRHYEEAIAIVQRASHDGPGWLRARWSRLAAAALFQLAREPEALQHVHSALESLGRPLPSVAGAAARHVWYLLRRDTPAAHDAVSAEVAQVSSLIALLAYRRHDLRTMLAAALHQANAAWRSQDPALRAEAFANLATILRIAGCRPIANYFGCLADTEFARSAVRPVALGSGDAANRARMARGLDHLSTGRLEEARIAFTECGSRTVDPRLAESCAGMLAETAVWQGDFGTACDLYTETAELAAQRVNDDIGRYWCLTGKAEALLRIESVRAGEVTRVLDAARASTERRLRLGARFGLHDDPAAQRIQQMRLLTVTARLHLREGTAGPADELLAQILTLAEGLPRAQPGMLECWSGLAELMSGLSPREHRQARTLEGYLTKFAARNPGAAARLGWAAALLHLAGGDTETAERTARRALLTARRLNAAYDAERARRLIPETHAPAHAGELG